MNQFVKNIREAGADESGAKASELIEQIKKAHSVTRVIGWPGHESVKIEMRLLSVAESRKAKVENQLEFKADGIEIAAYNLADYREGEAVHGMWRAFYDPATGERIFKSADEMRVCCTSDELTALCNAYNAFADEMDPNVNSLSDADFETLKDVLKKTPEKIPQKVTSLNLAWKLLRTLVAPAAK